VRSCLLGLQFRRQQPAVGRTTPREAEVFDSVLDQSTQPASRTTTVMTHLRKGPCCELDGTCNIKIAIKIGIPAKQELISLLNSPQHHCSRGTNGPGAIARGRRHCGQCAHRRQGGASRTRGTSQWLNNDETVQLPSRRKGKSCCYCRTAGAHLYLELETA
jgi:hypothetical protein